MNMKTRTLFKGMFFAMVFIIAMIPIADAACTVTIFTTPGGSGGDAQLGRNVTNATFTDIRNGPGTFLQTTSNTSYVRVSSDIQTDTFNRIWRGAYWFDTGTALPDDATIDSAKIGLYRLSGGIGLGDVGVGITKYTINGSWSADDYSNFNDERFAADILLSESTNNQYINWSLNPLGLSNISLTANSGFGVRMAWDIDNQSPAWINNTYSSVHVNTADNLIGEKPFIEITYTNGTCGAVIPAPEAAFINATPRIGTAQLTVTFTDLSTNTPTSWNWAYKNATVGWTQFSTDQSPKFTFPAGTYDINLTATNAGGSDDEIKTSFIEISAPSVPVTDTGVFRSGQWILDYGMDRVVDSRFQYGLPTDIPLTGDFNNG